MRHSVSLVVTEYLTRILFSTPWFKDIVIKKIFSCFVDFSKAFDTIPRDLLLKKIFDYGITGTFFNNIKSSMGSNDYKVLLPLTAANIDNTLPRDRRNQNKTSCPEAGRNLRPRKLRPRKSWDHGNWDHSETTEILRPRKFGNHGNKTSEEFGKQNLLKPTEITPRAMEHRTGCLRLARVINKTCATSYEPRLPYDDEIHLV